MRISIPLMVMSLLSPFILLSQEGSKQKTKSGTIKPAPKSQQQPSKSTNILKIHSVSDLRSRTTQLKPFDLGGGSEIPKVKSVGNSPYQAGNGVVLKRKQLLDSRTKSFLALYCLVYDTSANQDVLLQQGPEGFSCPKSEPSCMWLFSHSQFNGLPSGTHTYLLTLGGDGGSYAISIKHGSEAQHIFPDNQLTRNAAGNETYLLFTTNGAGSNLNVDVYCQPRLYFQYVQLVQFN